MSRENSKTTSNMLRMLLTIFVLLWIEAARFLLVCIAHAKHAAPRNYFADDSLGGLSEKKNIQVLSRWYSYKHDF